MDEGVLGSCVNVLLRRGKVFAVLNALCFGSVFVAVLLGPFFYVPPPYTGEPLGVLTCFLGLDWPWMLLAIFFSNLVLSGFVLVTLSGLLFFPLSAGVLVFRAVLWGLLLNQLSTTRFLLALPTLMLEGEGYVLASTAGITLGLSWFKPKWFYKDEGGSRIKALKTAFKECTRTYILVAILLFTAAIVETATITTATTL